MLPRGLRRNLDLVSMKTPQVGRGPGASGGEGTVPRRTTGDTLAGLFEHHLAGAYGAQSRLAAALEAIAARRPTGPLAALLDGQLSVASDQASRLEQVFALAGRPVRKEDHRDTDGLVEEALTPAGGRRFSGLARDQLSAGALARARRHGMLLFTTMARLADRMGLDEAGVLLRRCVEEEARAARDLMRAEREVEESLPPGEVSLPADDDASAWYSATAELRALAAED